MQLEVSVLRKGSLHWSRLSNNMNFIEKGTVTKGYYAIIIKNIFARLGAAMSADSLTYKSVASRRLIENKNTFALKCFRNWLVLRKRSLF